MSAALATYLHDHLAGSQLAVELLGRLREAHAGSSLATAAAQLLVDVEEDRAVLRTLIDRLGSPESAIVKNALAWVAEQGTRLKLRQAADGLGTLETLETLALGVLGKMSLWRALAESRADDPQLRDVDFGALIERAQRQHARVETYRLQVARELFSSAP